MRRLVIDLEERLLVQAGAGNTARVRELLAANVDPNCVDKEDGDRPLHRASMEGHVETIRALIEGGADVNARNIEGETPLHWAADCGSLAAVQLLVTAGAQVNTQDYNGHPASDFARDNEHSEVATFLRRFESLKERKPPSIHQR